MVEQQSVVVKISKKCVTHIIANVREHIIEMLFEFFLFFLIELCQ